MSRLEFDVTEAMISASLGSMQAAREALLRIRHERGHAAAIEFLVEAMRPTPVPPEIREAVAEAVLGFVEDDA